MSGLYGAILEVFWAVDATWMLLGDLVSRLSIGPYRAPSGLWGTKPSH